MEKNIERFYKTINDFFFELEENFPNMKESIQKYSLKIEFKEEKDKIKYILKYFENSKKYKDFITNSNGDVFIENDEVELIPEINFCKIWNVKYKSDEDKEKIWTSIWKFLQILFIISDLVNTMVNKKVDNKNEVDVNEMISNLQNSKSNINSKFSISFDKLFSSIKRVYQPEVFPIFSFSVRDTSTLFRKYRNIFFQ